MIHGAFCGAWAFADFRKVFEAAGHPIIAPDLRDHDKGHAPPSSLGNVSLLDYAQDLEKSLSGLNEPVIVMGHSMGGLLAQMLAARGNIPVHALVLLAPSAPWGMMPSTMFEYASAGAMFFAGDFWNKPVPPSYEVARANTLNLLSAKQSEAIYKNFVPESGLAMFEILHWALDSNRASDVPAQQVQCPVLCLVGDRDRVNPPSTVRRIAQRYGAYGRFEEWPNRSHWLIGDDGWEDLAQHIQTWLTRQG